MKSCVQPLSQPFQQKAVFYMSSQYVCDKLTKATHDTTNESPEITYIPVYKCRVDMAEFSKPLLPA